MVSSEHGESTTRTARAVEGGTSFDSNDPRGQTGIGRVSKNNGVVGFGTVGETGTPPDFAIALAGGIITQLIKQVEGQLGTAKYQVQNSEACIDWYQREKEEHLRRVHDLEEQLESLKHLESELQNQLRVESDESEQADQS